MKLTPEIYTKLVNESADFYCQHLGFEVKSKFPGFITLKHSVSPEFEIMFCEPNSEFVDKIFWPEYEGKGLIFQLETTNIDKLYKDLKQKNVQIALELVQEEFNGKHFTVKDPNGILIDIVELVN